MGKTYDIHNLIVFIEGGVVVGIYSDDPVEVSICDYDVRAVNELNDEYIKEMESKKAHTIKVY